jgi:hypothetical protein
MARPSWIEQIRYAATPAEQVMALRGLKNDLVGHPLKKEMAVLQGALDPIVHLSTNRQMNRSESKGHDHTFAHRQLAEGEMVRLQGLQVLASIALGRVSRSRDVALLTAAQEDRLSSVLCTLRSPSRPSSRISARCGILLSWFWLR